MNLSRRFFFAVGAGVATQVLMMAVGLAGAAGIGFNLLTPLPVAYAVLRAGPAAGLGAAILAALGLVAVGSPGSVPAYLLQFGLGSLLLPVLLRRGWRWDRAVACTVAVALAAAAVVLTGYSLWRGESLPQLIDGYIHQEVARALEMYQDENLEPALREELQAVAQRTGDFLARAWFGLAAVAVGLIQGTTLLLLQALPSGLRLEGGSFRQWRAPEWLIWGLILAGFGAVFLGGGGRSIALNLLTILIPVYFVQGLAVVSYFFARKGVSPLVRGIGYVLITLLNPLPVIVTGIGVFDLWVDFRKPRIKKS